MAMNGFCSRTFNASTFRDTVNASVLPTQSSVSIEGLFNEYFFQTGMTSTSELIAPSYLVSSSTDPLTKEQELYVAVGCNSREDGKNYRNPLNVVFVLDISGSMGTGFSPNHSLSSFTESNAPRSETRTKMQVAVDVLKEAVKILKPSERLSIVLFDTKVELLQPIRKVENIDMESLLERIDQVTHRGGTDMESGYSIALDIMSDMLKEEQPQGYDNRIIFLTDANPNRGGGEKTLLGMSKRAARNNIYTTYIGVGLDFDTDLVNEITKVKGSNYFSVHSASQFKKILNDDFNYIVTPIGFNAVLFIESEAYQIEKVYGTPYDGKSDAVMQVDTVTASPKDERGSKGGVILLKLKHKLTSNPNPSTVTKLILTYEDREGKKCRCSSEFDLQDKLNSLKAEEDKSVFENSGIRKAILLVRYANLLHQIIENNDNSYTNAANDRYGSAKTSSRSNHLQISNLMKEDVITFISHFKKELTALGDKSLNKELDILDKLRYSTTRN